MLSKILSSKIAVGLKGSTTLHVCTVTVQVEGAIPICLYVRYRNLRRIEHTVWFDACVLLGLDKVPPCNWN